MAEYWKSTPKYWCKDCKVYVRDTKFERVNHEATAKHQGNIRRSINDLHRRVEREEREKQRTKDELERLNRVVGGGGGGGGGVGATGPASQLSGSRPADRATFSKTPKAVATPEERKRQLAQLAALGVQVPEEFRRENAMIGEWETVAIKPVYEEQEAKLGKGESEIQERKRDLDVDETEESDRPAKRAWAPALKKYEYKKDKEEDIEALLSGVKASTPTVKQEDDGMKNEEIGTPNALTAVETDETTDAKIELLVETKPAVNEDPAPGSGIVFKKRKGKPKG